MEGAAALDRRSGDGGADQVDVRRALGEGLRIRPLADTVRATLETASPTDPAGLSPEREAELLTAWHAR